MNGCGGCNTRGKCSALGGAHPGRQAPRQPVLKLAKILFQGSAVDCLVLDISASGMRVSTQTMFHFPEHVRIELASGAVHAAVRCWQRGLETGFEFTALLGLTGTAALEARALHQGLSVSGVLDITARLARERYFDHPEIKAATGGGRGSRAQAGGRPAESVPARLSGRQCGGSAPFHLEAATNVSFSSRRS